MKRTILLFALYISFSITTLAQGNAKSEEYYVLIDAHHIETKQPVTSAAFYVTDETGKRVLELQADASGKASAKLPGKANYLVECIAEGFMTLVLPVRDLRPQNVVQFKMIPAKKEIEPLKIPEKGKAITLKNIYFDRSSPVLRSESQPELDALAEALIQNPAIRIEIRGHTDNAGDFDLNVKLSQERCQAVETYLIKKGIERRRLQSKGRGSLDPIAPNTSEENRKKNRRVEFVVL
ncbi:OmpA family protein [Runella slithyformis]|uniref:OmpA/MotB domain protein n=1 Tax=Runella slithyformis (strain ATCC 29530 / DSM 19594 / LMG 11500 / NCIMB 11436 / LSU 4) TaxID=761193 RepID=A0A7U3ZJ03_RUNSL|nr:OmpA family protein [Runella slithyformis]AEI48025.1 OmpA/MotB domain protein [Runella slithyformis DSM 19594]